MRLFILLTLVFSTNVFAIGEPKYSKVAAKAEAAQSKLEFEFKIDSTDSDMALSFEAPWKLELVNADGITFSSMKLNKAKMDEKLPGWKVQTVSAPTKNQGELAYKLTAFICTKNKTKCFREIHKGKVPWKVAEK